MKEFIEIPFGAKDSELGGWEYNIPEGYTASIENGKIVVKKEESDYERIRKSILTGLIDCRDAPDLGWSDFGGIPIDDCIAWLEKQGEQKPTDKVEPKFKIEKDKWYVCIKDLLDNYANKAFYKGDTYLSTQDGSLMPSNSNVPFEVVCPDTYFRDWTIQDANDGDVLDANGAPFIYKRHDKDYVYFYCGVNLSDDFIEANGIDTWNNNNKVYPATKEQRDLLFQKMKEAGYEWDAEKKKLKKVEQKLINWSEEDEEMLYSILNVLNGGLTSIPIGKYTNWLKSLKDRVQPQWKPEDIHLEALRCVINGNNLDVLALKDLLEQLKKL